MFAKMQELMDWRVSLLIGERFDDLAGEYLYPLALYQGDSHRVVVDQAGMADSLAKLRVKQKALGITGVTARVTAVDLPRNGRFRVWVSYREHGPLGEELATVDVVQYCCETSRGIRTEMTEYSRCSLADQATEPKVAAIR